MGSEVKSIRAGVVRRRAYWRSAGERIGCRIELWRHIGHEPDRSRKLPDKRDDRLSKAVHAKGRMVVPLRTARGLLPKLWAVSRITISATLSEMSITSLES